MGWIKDKQLIDDFLKDCELRNMSEHSIESYGSSLNIFLKFINSQDYSFLSIDRKILKDCIEYFHKNKLTYKTIQNRFSAYVSFYDYLVYEELFENNIVRDFGKRYLSKYKDERAEKRKIISVDEMARFIHSIPDIRDKTIALLFAKTGIRRRELVALDLDDIKWENMSITLKPTKKRSNRIVYFDYEASIIIKKWLEKRKYHAAKSNKALFVSYINKKKRLNRNGVAYIFVKWATIAGLHNPKSKKLEERFTPHNARHWYTTHLRRAGMQREFISELRGDKRKAAMDIYYHIDHEELRKSYLACIPKLGVE